MNDKSRAVSARQAGVAVLLLLAALIVVAAVLPLSPAARGRRRVRWWSPAIWGSACG